MPVDQADAPSWSLHLSPGVDVDSEPTVSHIMAHVSEKRLLIGKALTASIANLPQLLICLTYAMWTPHELILKDQHRMLRTWRFAHGACVPVQARCLASGVAAGHEYSEKTS